MMGREQQKEWKLDSDNTHILMHIYQEETREEEKHENQNPKGMTQ